MSLVRLLTTSLVTESTLAFSPSGMPLTACLVLVSNSYLLKFYIICSKFMLLRQSSFYILRMSTSTAPKSMSCPACIEMSTICSLFAAHSTTLSISMLINVFDIAVAVF